MKSLKMNNCFFAALLAGGALLATSCTIYDDFDESLVDAYIAKHSPAEPESSSSDEDKSSSSEEEKPSSSEEVLSSSSEEAKSSSSEKEDSSSSENASSSSEGCPETFEDERDGTVYDVVDVFDRKSKTSRCWFAKNLEYNQDYSVCYDNDDMNCKTYGRLYSGDRLDNKGQKAACPEGTHIATLDDLQHFISMTGLKDCSVEKDVVCDDAALYMKKKQGWEESGSRSGLFDLGMLPGGAYDGESDKFGESDKYGYWWVADDSFDAGYGFMLLDDFSDALTITDVTKEDLGSTFYSIRCVIDF